MPNPKVLISFGSPSDMTLLTTELRQKLKADKKVDYYLSVASAHRTPEIVEKHASAYTWDAILACAGLTNALLSEYVKRAPPQTIVVGVPVYDKGTEGLASLLSSQELPQGYPAVCAGMDDLSAGLSIVNALFGRYDKVVLCNFVKEQAYKSSAEALLNQFKISYRTVNGTAVPESGELTLAIGDPDDVKALKTLISIVTAINIQEPCTFKQKYSLGNYKFMMKYSPSTAFVGFKNPANLVLFGAKVLCRNNPELADKIQQYINEGKKKYEQYKELQQLNP